MAEATIFRIPLGDVGAFALELVDRAAIGYTDDWQAPMGGTFPTVAFADYDANSASWQCQITSSAITATDNDTTTPRKGTFCQAPGQTVTVGMPTFSMVINAFQDINDMNGLQAFLLEHVTEEAYVYWSADGPDAAPRAIGRVRLKAGQVGGDAWTDLEFNLTLPFMRLPTFEAGHGTGATTRIVEVGGVDVVAAAASTPVSEDEREPEAAR